MTRPSTKQRKSTPAAVTTGPGGITPPDRRVLWERDPVRAIPGRAGPPGPPQHSPQHPPPFRPFCPFPASFQCDRGRCSFSMGRRPHSNRRRGGLFYRYECIVNHRCPSSLVRRRRVLLRRSRHRRQRTWPGTVDMPCRLSHGRIPQQEELTGFPNSPSSIQPLPNVPPLRLRPAGASHLSRRLRTHPPRQARRPARRCAPLPPAPNSKCGTPPPSGRPARPQ